MFTIWNLTFVRSLNNWEEDSICSLLALLASKEVLAQGNDVIVWPLTSKGSFPLRVFVPLRWKRRAVGMVHPRSYGILEFLLKLFFAWTASKGKISMEDKFKEEILVVLVDALVFGG